jgi:hypothetical protein
VEEPNDAEEESNQDEKDPPEWEIVLECDVRTSECNLVVLVINFDSCPLCVKEVLINDSHIREREFSKVNCIVGLQVNDCKIKIALLFLIGWKEKHLFLQVDNMRVANIEFKILYLTSNGDGVSIVTIIESSAIDISADVLLHDWLKGAL